MNISRCANGYHGDPTVAGQECVVCECNGNVDPWEPGHCDTSSGMCLKCHSHTSGDQCERCEDGYYGDAITAKNCQGTRAMVVMRKMMKRRRMMRMIIVLLVDSSTDPHKVIFTQQATSLATMY